MNLSLIILSLEKQENFLQKATKQHICLVLIMRMKVKKFLVVI